MLTKKQIVDFLLKSQFSILIKGENVSQIKGFCALDDLCDSCITWAKNEKFLTNQVLNAVSSNLIICPPIDATLGQALLMHGCDYIECDSPKAAFFSVVEEFFVEKSSSLICNTSVVETENVGRNVSIGHFCHIGKDVVIGNDVIIHDNVSIVCPTTIGDGVEMFSGVVVGSTGYGYYTGITGEQCQVPHVGGVEIGAGVSIGANCCIDRGTIGNTIIGENVKIDNLCHIAHNVNIGKGSMVVALSLLGGSAVLGEDTYIAPCASVMNQIHIGNNAFVGMGAVVTKNVEENKVVAGVPAKVLRDRE